jgi:Negative regulator of sigma E activity
MSDKISELLNGRLDEAQTRALLDELARDPALRDRLTLYGLAGDVLRGNSTPDDGFTRRILERMERENAAIEPGYDPLADGS